MENHTGIDQDPQATESRQFANLRRACRKNDPHEALRSLIIWIGITHFEQGSDSIEQFTLDIGSGRLAKHILFLRKARISDSKTWQGDALLNALLETRNTLLGRNSNQRPV